MTRNFDYWRNRGVSGPKPIPFVGNAWDIILFKKTIGLWLKTFYDDAVNEPYVGIFVFDEPFLVIKSPEIIKQILVKDFSYFQDRSVAALKDDGIYSNVMFLQKSPAWKPTRSKLTSTFTSGKLKSLLPVMNVVGENLKHLVGSNCGTLDAKEIATKYTIDSTAKIFFGINAHCLDHVNSKFFSMGKSMFEFSLRNGFVQTSYFFKPSLVNLFKLPFFTNEVTQQFVSAFWSSVNIKNEENKNSYTFIDILKEIRKHDPEFGK